jgi:hypothetical protein
VRSFISIELNIIKTIKRKTAAPKGKAKLRMSNGFSLSELILCFISCAVKFIISFIAKPSLPIVKFIK